MTATPPAGWYPDPAGSPASRWWDGHAWTAQTRATGGPGGYPPGGGPGTPPPGSGGQGSGGTGGQSGSGGGRGSRKTFAVVVAALAVAALLIGLAVWQVPRLLAPASVPTPLRPGSTATPTASGWDESATASPGPTPTAAPSASGAPGSCPAQPTSIVVPTQYDPLQVGKVAVPVPDGWSGPAPDPRIPMARDVWQVYQPVDEQRGWASSLSVGFVYAEDSSFTGTAETATVILECIVNSSLYSGTNAILAESETTEITVDGVRGSRIDGVIALNDPQLTTRASVFVVIVLDTSSPQFVFGAAPVENATHIKALRAAADGVRVVR